MNNNFTKTEKSLKHWLKNKITVTSATVVSFLIMGTIAFGAVEVKGETKTIDKDTELSETIEVIKQDESVGVSIVKEGVNLTLTNKSDISATSKNTKALGIKSDVKANVTNNGKITAKALNEDKTGLDPATQDTATGIALNKGGKAENNGTINATGYRATGIEAKDEATVTNNKDGKIIVKSEGKNPTSQGRTAAAFGINLNNSTGVNHGTIETTSGELSQGVNVYISKEFNPTKNVFENHGKIVATSTEGGGGSSNAISIKSETDKEITIINKAGATLETNDNFSDDNNNIGNIIDNTSTVRIEKGKIAFINDGNINTKNNGIGIYAVDNKSSVTNNGAITVTGDKGAGVFSTGEFTNNKTIDVNTKDMAIGVQSNNKVINSEDGNITVNSKSGTGILLKGKGVVENSGDINVTGIDKAYGVELVAKEGVSTANLLNTGNITVKNDTDNKIAYGVYLENGATATNAGKIEATSQGRAAGVHIFLNTDYKGNTEQLFVNEKEGTITANSTNGGTANAISIINRSTQKATIKNEGTLISTGKNGINTANGKPLYNPVVDLAGRNVEFINNGTIVAGNGVGIHSNGYTEIDHKPVGDSKMAATNNGTIEVNSTGKAIINSGGTSTNNGIIKITDKTAEELKDFDTNSLFGGKDPVTNNGLFADANGMDIDSGDSLAKIEIYTSELTGESIKIGRGDKSILIGDETPAGVKTLNVVGKVQVGDKKEANEVKLAVQNLNFTSNANFNVGADDNLILGDQDKNIIVNMAEDQSKATQGDIITLENGAKLSLENATINKGVNISGAGTVSAIGKNIINSNITSNSFDVFDGETLFNGVLSSDTVTVDKGALNKDTKLTFSSEASFGKATTINSNDGTTVFEIGAKGENALKNSQGIVDVNGNIDFDTDKLTQNTTVDLGKQNDLKDAIYTEKTDGIYNTKLDKDNKELEFTYNKQLFANEKLNAVNNGFQILGDKVTSDIAQRESLADEVYSSNIYSTTVRVAYDNLRLNEETLLSMNHRAGAGELKTFGKGLFSKDKFERRGINNDYSVDVETTGLLAGLEYGLSDSTTVGTVFSGSKQDVDVDHGSSDGDVLYLGVFGNKVVNNYDFTAGLGYQFGKYESDNSLISNTGDKYDSNAISGYVQGRYTADLGNGLSLQPRIKFGYTHLEQDDVRDANFALTNSDINTFNTEAGVDFVKTVQLDSSKLDVKLGTAYIKTMGDTDKTFTGQFFGDTAGSQFEVLGGELTENTIKFSLDAEMTFENGFFYNAGVNYRFGGEDTKVYGASVGIGYTF